MERFVVEGTWSGYSSSQERVVHRTVHHKSEKKLLKWLQERGCIRYTDGTALYVSMRPCKPGERVKGIVNGYGSLIRDCVYYDASSVDEMIAKRNAVRPATTIAAATAIAS